MTDELMRDFAVGGAALGSLSAWYFYTYASMQLPVGMLMDRYGPRKLMAFAVGLCALASVGFSVSESLWMAAVSRALVGATVAFAFIGSLTIAGYWFSPKRFAMLAGMLQAVGMCGAVLGQAPLRYAVEQWGWRPTMGGLAIFAISLSGLLFLSIPRRPLSLTARHTETLSHAFAGLRQVCVNPQSWYCAGTGFGLAAIMLSFGGLWSVPWLNTVMGFSKTQSAAIASMLFLGWAIVSPVVGWLSDYLGHRKPLLILGCLANMMLFMIVLKGGFVSVSAYSILFFLCGCSGSVMTISFSSVKEVNSPAYGATAIGLMNMCVVGSGAVMQPLIGWLLDRQWLGHALNGARIYEADAFTQAFTVLLVANGGALVCSLLLRETHCRQDQ